MISWKQIVGVVLLVGCIVVLIVAHRAKKRYMNEIKALAEESNEE